MSLALLQASSHHNRPENNDNQHSSSSNSNSSSSSSSRREEEEHPELTGSGGNNKSTSEGGDGGCHYYRFRMKKFQLMSYLMFVFFWPLALIVIKFKWDNLMYCTGITGTTPQQQLPLSLLPLPSSSSSSSPPDMATTMYQFVVAQPPSIASQITGNVSSFLLLSAPADYGTIHYHSIQNETVYGRTITQLHNQTIVPNKDKYMFGHIHNSERHYDDIDFPKSSGCYKPKWSYEVHPSCNTFHELSLNRPPPLLGQQHQHHHHQQQQQQHQLQTVNVTYLGRGTFRQGWSVSDTAAGYNVALKTIRYYDKKDTVTPSSYDMTQSEANTMIQTSASNRTMSIYGHCSTSIFVERGTEFHQSLIYGKRGRMSESKLHKKQKQMNQLSLNNLTSEEKLIVSLQMAEGLAEMHGNRAGITISHDVSLDQWLLGQDDGIIKLNDFNKAKALMWNYDKQQYCKYYSNQTLLYYAPEELTSRGTNMVNEVADVHTFGKLMYTILTGLRPYYSLKQYRATASIAEDGEAPYIDPRYYYRMSNATTSSSSSSTIESRLVTIMERTWIVNPQQRASIFDVVHELRQTARLHNVNTTIWVH